MTIPKDELEVMNDLISKGSKITDLVRKYPKYDYMEIALQVNDYSILGKKRMVTNRINTLVKESSKLERKKIAEDAQTMLNELYELLKINSTKLIDIDKVLRK